MRFYFEHAKFEMLMGHPDNNVQEVMHDLGLELRKSDRSGIHLHRNDE